MNLEKFKEKNQKRNWIIGSGIALVLLLAVVIIIRTYAVYEEKVEYDVIEGRVPSYLADYDVKVNITIDGVGSTKIPDKGTKGIESIVCDKGAIGKWDYINWAINVGNLSNTKTTCQVNFVSKYTESILNGTDPVLKEGLIPVTISDNGEVKKADITNEWYSYEKKTWANAVILNDETLTYQNGEVIPEDNIESYFVWIPRYRYKIFNDGKYEGLTKVESREKEIEVIFESNTVQDSKGTGVGQWLTHPAFTSFDTNGMWVGKFETGYKGSTDKVSAEVNTTEPEKVQIKPNVNSWRSIQVSNAFYSSYDYKREMESHMMKNTEWGAIAYLQHSKYGSATSVRINNNEDYVTGYAAVKEPTCGYTGTNEECNKFGTSEDITKPYNTTVGYTASTTGNISGIYDMSGSAWEYVMGVMVDNEGNPMSGRNSKYNSGFNGTFGCPTCDDDVSGLTSLTNGKKFPDSKYYDQYVYSNSDTTYQRRILGDATGEIGPFVIITYGVKNRQIGSWYQDEALFVYLYGIWFNRSGHLTMGQGTGAFAFGRDHGGAWSANSFRVVLSV
ncbi:MAG: hypothetical protein HFI09_05280 [Bacilli bacterium]|nr:hypothetical protein [Bacilli bacterium]